MYQSFPPYQLDSITPALGAATTTLTFSGLDGDSIGDYWIDYQINVAQNACSITARPNGVVTNQKALNADRLVGGTQRTDFAFARAGTSPFLFTSGDVIYGWAYFRAKSGRARYYQAQTFIDQATDDCFEVFGAWTDTTTNLTSFDFTAGVASGIGTGSFIRVTRMYRRT